MTLSMSSHQLSDLETEVDIPLRRIRAGSSSSGVCVHRACGRGADLPAHGAGHGQHGNC